MLQPSCYSAGNGQTRNPLCHKIKRKKTDDAFTHASHRSYLQDTRGHRGFVRDMQLIEEAWLPEKKVATSVSTG